MIEDLVPPSEKRHGAVAVVGGVRVTEIPEDLYIPPDALEVFLESFEGPLDLLLYLIRRENLSVVDLPVAKVAQQYLAYIRVMTELRLELAAEYLLMAALLAEIKSRMLLPRPSEPAAEEEDPRAELIRRLQEYERYKHAAEWLDRLPRLERDLHEVAVDTAAIQVPKHYPKVLLDEVLLAFREVLRRAEQMTHHQIAREPLSVRERITRILGRLRAASDPVSFTDLFEPVEGRAGVVVTLLALLELARERLVEVLQSAPLAPILVRALETTES